MIGGGEAERGSIQGRAQELSCTEYRLKSNEKEREAIEVLVKECRECINVTSVECRV